MRTLLLLMLAAFVLAGSVADVAGPDATNMNVGPYAGILTAEATAASHHYQNAPDGTMCIQIVQPYLVSLVHAPADATLRLSVGTHTVETTGGMGTLAFEAGVCAAFDIQVELLEGDAAGYAIDVRSGPVAGGGGPVTEAIVLS